jgi:hypothetical protein
MPPPSSSDGVDAPSLWTPRAPTLATLPVPSRTRGWSTSCRRSCGPLLLGHRAPYPGLLRLPRQGRAMAAPLRPFARTPPRCCCWSPSTMTGLRLRKPVSQQAPWQLDGPAAASHQGDHGSGPAERSWPGASTSCPHDGSAPLRYVGVPPSPAGPGFGRPRAGCQPGSPGWRSINTVARMSSIEPTLISA